MNDYDVYGQRYGGGGYGEGGRGWPPGMPPGAPPLWTNPPPPFPFHGGGDPFGTGGGWPSAHPPPPMPHYFYDGEYDRNGMHHGGGGNTPTEYPTLLPYRRYRC